MARRFDPGVDHARIVSFLLQGKPIREIARKLGKYPGTVLKMANQLNKHGYISRQVRSDHSLYSILLPGYALLDMFRTPEGNSGNACRKKPQILPPPCSSNQVPLCRTLSTVTYPSHPVQGSTNDTEEHQEPCGPDRILPRFQLYRNIPCIEDHRAGGKIAI